MMKDEILNRLPFDMNVAQFVSFCNNGVMRFSRVRGYQPNHRFENATQAVEALFKTSPDGTLNIRTFTPVGIKSGPFIVGIKTPKEVHEKVAELWKNGFYVSIHETVNVSDNGVSGVILKNMIEFSPDATPRCVEGEGTCRLPFTAGELILQEIYGVSLYVRLFFLSMKNRIEFSIHPIKRGYLSDHLIVWEIEPIVDDIPCSPVNINWPNNFSKMLGDKVYGLMIANVLGFQVPETWVINRRVAPFKFGKSTGQLEKWIRTCPATPEPGLYPTEFGWTDPFEMVNYFNYEKTSEKVLSLFRSKPGKAAPIQSVISQSHIDAAYSGAVQQLKSGKLVIEGVQGRGDGFMLGDNNESLPEKVITAVTMVYESAVRKLGPVHIEWVMDTKDVVWVVQLHIDTFLMTAEDTIVPGDISHYVEFDVTRGLDALRETIDLAQRCIPKHGIYLMGNVGVTSHFGDLLRKANIPSKINRKGIVE